MPWLQGTCTLPLSRGTCERTAAVAAVRPGAGVQLPIRPGSYARLSSAPADDSTRTHPWPMRDGRGPTDEAARCALTAAGMALGLVAVWAVLVPLVA